MKYLPLIAALLIVLVGPILLRPKEDTATGRAEQTVVVVTPHNESIRFEFSRGFADHYFRKTGKHVRVDFRTPGGTSEITRYIDSEYLNSFQKYWEKDLGRKWSESVKKAFADSKMKLDDTPVDDTPEQQARRAFLGSSVSCKIDLFFGGGAYDFQQAAAKGQFVSSGYIEQHPETFGPGDGKIPLKLSGEPYYDSEGRWMGAVVSAFGIVSNRDVLQRLGIAEPPRRWSDLADPRLFGQVALANPTQSSSINKAFEMLIQQQIAAELSERNVAETDEAAIAAGWIRGLRLLQKIGANARYFTDTSTKPSLDVAAGDCAAGMTIDFYGRFQAESEARQGRYHLQYFNAEGGTSVGVDPISMFRGAPNPELAKAFIAYVMSPEGQKLWNWNVKAPGGPRHYALRRLPILPALYAEEFRPLRTDPEVFPYEMAKQFVYRESWTAALFKSQGFIIRVMCIDTHEELAEAWHALIVAGFPPEATTEFERLDPVSYAATKSRIKEALGPNKIDEVQLAKELGDGFRAQYRKAAELAKQHR